MFSFYFPQHIKHHTLSSTPPTTMDTFLRSLWMEGVSCQQTSHHHIPFPPHPISFLSCPYKNPRNPCSAPDPDECPQREKHPGWLGLLCFSCSSDYPYTRQRKVWMVSVIILYYMYFWLLATVLGVKGKVFFLNSPSFMCPFLGRKCMCWKKKPRHAPILCVCCWPH